MFTIIKNYKKLTLTFLKNEFAGGLESSTLTADDFKGDEPGNDLKALRKALKNGINDDEAKIISEEIEDISSNAKQGLEEVASSLLKKDGFKTMNENSYNSFKNIIKLSGSNLKIPTWKALENATKDSFSFGLTFNKREFVLDEGFKSDDFHGITIIGNEIQIKYDGIGRADTLILEITKDGRLVTKGWENIDGEEDDVKETKLYENILDDNIELVDGKLSKDESTEALKLLNYIKLFLELNKSLIGIPKLNKSLIGIPKLNRFKSIENKSISIDSSLMKTNNMKLLNKSDLYYLKKFSGELLELDNKLKISRENKEKLNHFTEAAKNYSELVKKNKDLIEKYNKSDSNNKITLSMNLDSNMSIDDINKNTNIIEGLIAKKNKIEAQETADKNFISWNKKHYTKEGIIVIQEALIKEGILESTYNNRKGEDVSSADGDFGSGTLAAIKEMDSTDPRVGLGLLKKLKIVNVDNTVAEGIVLTDEMVNQGTGNLNDIKFSKVKYEPKRFILNSRDNELASKEISNKLEAFIKWFGDIFSSNEDLASFIGTNGDKIYLEYDKGTNTVEINTTMFDGVSDFEYNKETNTTMSYGVSDFEKIKVPTDIYSIEEIKSFVEKIKKEYDKKVLEQAIAGVQEKNDNNIDRSYVVSTFENDGDILKTKLVRDVDYEGKFQRYIVKVDTTYSDNISDELVTYKIIDINNKKDIATAIKKVENKYKEKINKLKAKHEKLADGNFEISNFKEEDGKITVNIDGKYDYIIDGTFEGDKVNHIYEDDDHKNFTSISTTDDHGNYFVKINTGINDGVADKDTVTKLDLNEFDVSYIDKENYKKAQLESIKKYIKIQNKKYKIEKDK